MSANIEQLYKKYKKSLLSKKEAAEELNISIATLDRLRKQGLIRSKKVGGGIYFTLNELATFIGE
jgi:predicted site-specific integrase-resolvase